MANRCFYIHLLLILLPVFQVSGEWNPLTANDIMDINEQKDDTAADIVDNSRRLTDFDAVGDNINKIPYIYAQTQKIPQIIADVAPIDEIKTAVSTVKNVAIEIKDKVEVVIDGFQCAVSALDPSNLQNLFVPADDEAITAVKSTLDQCILDLLSVADLDFLRTITDTIQSRINFPDCFDALFETLDQMDVEQFFNMIPGQVTSVLAEALVNVEPLVDLFCTVIVPEVVGIINGLKTLITQIISQFSIDPSHLQQDVPSATTYDKCNPDDDGLCTAADIGWYIAKDEGLYHSFIESFKALLFPNGISGASDANRMATWRTALMILDPVQIAIEGGCQVIAELEVGYGVDFSAMAACETVDILFKIGMIIVKNLVEFADFHDGMIMVAQNDALLQNTQNIIRNQQSLMSFLLSFPLPQDPDCVHALTLGSDDNQYRGVMIDLGEAEFNRIFWESPHHIIKRECEECLPEYQVMWYRRLQIDSRNIYRDMRDWSYIVPFYDLSDTTNIPFYDFNLYSTLDDALAKTNHWTGVYIPSSPEARNYYDGMGAFGICGVTGDSMLADQYVKNAYEAGPDCCPSSLGALFSIYVGDGNVQMDPLVPLNNDDKLVINISSRNLYILGISVTGFIILFIALGVIIGVKCGYAKYTRSQKHTSIKYIDPEFELDNTVN